MYNRAAGLLIKALILALLGCLPAFASDVVAMVDDIKVTRDEFERQAYVDARQTFFHGRSITNGELVEFRRKVADDLIEQKLLLREAKQRDLIPAEQSIAARLAVYEDRYSDSERWQTEGTQMLARLREQFEKDSLLALLEEQVKAVDDPGVAAIREYYDANLEKFTQPEQIRVSVILLSVSPSSAKAVWDAAREEAKDIVRQIRAGGSFVELARMRSADATAVNGGDMGYLHVGVLNEASQQALQGLGVDELAEPVRVLEGIAIFRLTGRKPAKLQPFNAVTQRAEELWRRDAGEREWQQLIARLRQQSEITIDEEYLQSLPSPSN